MLRHELVDLDEILREAEDELEGEIGRRHDELGEEICREEALGLGLVGELERPLARTATLADAADRLPGSASGRLTGSALRLRFRLPGLMPA
jgi:hypothetical protein